MEDRNISLAFLWALILLIWSCSNDHFSPPYDPDKRYAPRELQEDFHVLVTSLKEAHGHLNAYISPEEFENQTRNIKRRLDREMTDIEFYRLLAPFVSSIRCGHTEINPSLSQLAFWDARGNFLPFEVDIIEGKVIIRHDHTRQPSLPEGSEVLSINAHPVREIIQTMLRNTSGDGFILTRKYKNIEEQFSLFYQRWIENPPAFSVKLRLHASTEARTVRVAPLSGNELKKRITRASAGRPEPPNPISLIFYEDLSTAILKIETFYTKNLNNSGFKYQRKFREVFRKLKIKSIQNLIIDVRGNEGGSLKLGAELFSYLAPESFRFLKLYRLSPSTKLTFKEYFRSDSFVMFKAIMTRKENDYRKFALFQPLKLKKRKERYHYDGNLIVLIDGNTFSAASLWAALVHNHKRAVFIGEECGGAYAGNGISPLYGELPNTGLRISIPFGYVMLNEDSPPHFGRGVLPDHVVHPCPSNALLSQDPVIQYALTKVK